jgi:Protein of unknown function (DUF1064)
MNDREAWAKFITAQKGAVNVLLRIKRPKYGNTPVIVDGLAFDSKREAVRYQELKMLQKAGKIAHLETQPAFPIQVVALWRQGPPWHIEHCGMYTADFRYLDLVTGEVKVEDIKTRVTKTESYRLRKRLVEAIHGVVISEVE